MVSVCHTSSEDKCTHGPRHEKVSEVQFQGEAVHQNASSRSSKIRPSFSRTSKASLQASKTYRPISLLCVPYKILERQIYNRVEPIVDPLLPKEQAGFRPKNSAIDQVVLLTQNIENSFEAKKKAIAMFVNLTAAYDTLWHRGFTCKLLRLLPDNHMVQMITELVRNRSFTITTGDSKPSRI